MRGGSRIGAGRPAYKRKTSGLCRLDVPKMAAQGHLRPGNRFSWAWWRDGQQCASISVQVEESRLLLQYDQQGQSVSFPVDLTRTSCNYGGSRLWACCPRCRRRVGVLYLIGASWACRTCGRLTYPSQSEDPTGRAWRAQDKIESRLAGGAGKWNGWRKPKGMHQNTFDRLRERIFEYERIRDMALGQFAARFLGIEAW